MTMDEFGIQDYNHTFFLYAAGRKIFADFLSSQSIMPYEGQSEISRKCGVAL
jgi:hypothetical protein